MQNLAIANEVTRVQMGSLGFGTSYSIGHSFDCRFFSGQNPHEQHLNDEGVDGEEICALVFLCSGYCVGLAIPWDGRWVIRTVRKKYVFE